MPEPDATLPLTAAGACPDRPADPLAAALDALVPGNADWPAASAAISPKAVVDMLSPEDRTWFAALANTSTDWSETWRSVETEPAFARVYAALTDAYYSSPPVAHCLRRLAEASPRDPDSRFDPALLRRTSPTERP